MVNDAAAEAPHCISCGSQIAARCFHHFYYYMSRRGGANASSHVFFAFSNEVASNDFSSQYRILPTFFISVREAISSVSFFPRRLRAFLDRICIYYLVISRLGAEIKNRHNFEESVLSQSTLLHVACTQANGICKLPFCKY